MSNNMNRILKSLCLLIVLVSLASCGSKEPFIWAETLPSDNAQSPPYMIQPGDSIDVVVWDQPQISGVYTVREDGFITVPLLGDLRVEQLSPMQTAGIIGEKLEGDIVQNVRVVVISRTTGPEYVTVLGEVSTPGQYALKHGDTILDVLAMAGGLTEFADEDSIYLLRSRSPSPRIRFDYDRLTTQKNGGNQFQLQDGDIIFVE